MHDSRRGEAAQPQVIAGIAIALTRRAIFERNQFTIARRNNAPPGFGRGHTEASIPNCLDFRGKPKRLQSGCTVCAA